MLVHQPRGVHHLAAKTGSLGDRAHLAEVTVIDRRAIAHDDGAPFAVHFVIAQLAEHTRTVNFRRQQFCPG